MQPVLQLTLEQVWNTQNLLPITLSFSHLIDSLHKITHFDRIDYTRYNDEVTRWNDQAIDILIDMIKHLEELLFFGWPISREYIQRQIRKYLSNRQIVGPLYLATHSEKIKENLFQLYLKIEVNVYEFTETLVTQLVEDYLQVSQLDTLLNEMAVNQLHRFAYDFFDFAYIDRSERLLDAFQNVIKRITYDFFKFLIDISFLANKEMHHLNSLLAKHPSLANPENYKYIQKELSQQIMKQGRDLLTSKSFNTLPDLHHQIVKKAIVHFYYMIEEYRYWYQFKGFESIESLIDQADFKIVKPMPQNIQILNSPYDLKLFVHYGSVTVLGYKYAKLDKYQGLLINVSFGEKRDQFLINLVGHYLIFHQYFEGWVLQSEGFIETTEKLVPFLNQQFEYLHQDHPEFKKRLQSEKSSEKDIDESAGFQNAALKFKKISCPKKPIRYGTRMNVVGAKALGAGLGCLIVDCLDEDIPWEEKLKNAGFTAVSLGFLGILASRLPIVGLLIQQVILCIAVKQILDNKVISDKESGKNIGHLTVQITIGVGMTIAGSIMFPVAFWGAFFGGLLGGIGMGLYGKFVVPYSMSNLMDMLNKAQILIRRGGLVRYKPYAVRVLKIDETYLPQRKPKGLDENTFFTLLMFCLTNEVKLVCSAYYHKDMEKYSKEKKEVKMAETLKRQVQREVQLREWDGLKEYLQQRKVSILENAAVCAEFVEGMLSNFKVK